MSDTSNSDTPKAAPKRATKAAGSKPETPKSGADRLRENVQKARDALGDQAGAVAEP